MKLSSIIGKSVFIFTIIILFASQGYSGGNDDIRTKSIYSFSNAKETKPYLKDAEKLLKKRNAFFNLDVDIQLGLGIANTNFDLNKTDSATQTLNSTSTKIGPSIGAIVSVDFLGVGFTSGFQYSNKGFESTTGDKTSLNYFNIPLLFYFDFNIGDKIRVDGNLGPYFGLLLSQDNNPLYKVKNFDFGLTGNLQGAYMFNRYIGVLLGAKYEYGGLNNLGNNENVKKITSSTFNIYSGIKFEL